MEPHGELTFLWEKHKGHQLLIVNAHGPFNNEGRERAGDAYIKVLAESPSDNFSIIEIWDENSLASTEVMNQIGVFWKTLLPNNCSNIAIVASNFIQESFIESFLPSNGQIFRDIMSAKKWLFLDHQPSNKLQNKEKFLF